MAIDGIVNSTLLLRGCWLCQRLAVVFYRQAGKYFTSGRKSDFWFTSKNHKLEISFLQVDLFYEHAVWDCQKTETQVLIVLKIATPMLLKQHICLKKRQKNQTMIDIFTAILIRSLSASNLTSFFDWQIDYFFNNAQSLPDTLAPPSYGRWRKHFTQSLFGLNKHV